MLFILTELSLLVLEGELCMACNNLCTCLYTLSHSMVSDCREAESDLNCGSVLISVTADSGVIALTGQADNIMM